MNSDTCLQRLSVSKSEQFTKIDENSELRETDYAKGQISEHIFSRNIRDLFKIGEYPSDIPQF